MACNSAKLLLPKAGYRSSSANEAGSKGRTFSSLDCTHSYSPIHIEIDGTDFGLCIRGDLFFHFGRAAKLLLHRRMQPPLFSPSHELRTTQIHAIRQLTASETALDPRPATSGPDFEHDA